MCMHDEQKMSEEPGNIWNMWTPKWKALAEKLGSHGGEGGCAMVDVVEKDADDRACCLRMKSLRIRNT